MDLLVTNVTRPMTVETWSGMLYTLITIEASMHYIEGVLLKTKAEVAKSLKGIIARLEQQSG